MFFRIFTALFGLFFVSSTIQWLTNPKMAAEGLAMDLVTGMGLNSQIGDFTAFFFALSAFLLIGVVRESRDFIMAAMLLLGSAAVFRILASLFHDAPLMSVAVVFELVGTAVFAGYWRQLNKYQ